MLEPRRTPIDLAEGADVGEQVDPAQVWTRTAHLVSTPYDPRLEAVRYARSFVRAQLEAIGLGQCADDAGLMVSELAANAVLHARTPFTIHLRPTLEGGARVEVHDHSPLPPVHTAPSASAMSGRGLDLVASMATRWGSHSLLEVPGSGTTADEEGGRAGTGGEGAGGPGAAAEAVEPAAPEGQVGKIVWFEVEVGTAGPVVEASVEELLALWSDQEEHPASRRDASADPQVGPAREAADSSTRLSAAGGDAQGRGPDRRRRPRSTPGIITSSLPVVEATQEVVVRDLAVADLVAAKEAMDDLLREAQLLLLATPAGGITLPSPRPRSADGTAATGGRTNQLNSELVVAARLDAAARAFEGARRQIREQATRAAARGERRVTLRLRLPVSARAAAVRYRDAVAAAEQLRAHGHLLALTSDIDVGTTLRSHFLAQIIDQLAPASTQDGA